MKHNYVVYKHTAPNGKSYIGITGQKPNDRWGVGGRRYARYNAHFYSAIQRYGWENFSHDILVGGLSKEKAREIEINLISLFGTQDRERGYNKTSGGDGVRNLVSEARMRISKARSKKTNQYSAGGKYIQTFDSATEAANHVAGDSVSTGIGSCLVGTKNSWGGFQWRYDTGENRRDIQPIESHPHTRTVIQYNKNMEEVACFDTIRNAAKAVNGNGPNISKCCNRKIPTAYGYMWRYAR